MNHKQLNRNLSSSCFRRAQNLFRVSFVCARVLVDWLIYCYFCWGSLRADLYTSPGDNTTNALSTYNLCGKSREIIISMILSKSPLKFGPLSPCPLFRRQCFQSKTTDRWCAGDLRYHKSVKLDAAQLVAKNGDLIESLIESSFRGIYDFMSEPGAWA